jgi:membrane protein
MSPSHDARMSWASAVLKFSRDLALLAKDAGVRWADDACYRLGASLAYYALFSIFPLLLLAVTGVGFILGSDDSARQKLLSSLSSPSPEFRALLDQTLQSMQQHRTARGVGAVVGGVALLFGASGVFSELESSLNLIWKVKGAPIQGVWSFVVDTVRSKALSFAIVVVAATALLASIAVSTALGALAMATSSKGAAREGWQLAETAVSLALLTALLSAVFAMIPQTRVESRDVVGAAALTSLLFTALKALLAWYVAHLGSYAAYGAVGGVLGLLTWIYVASAVLFYGAEFSRVYAERFGSLARAQC